jgi:outer membrane lipoprotein-sorting protein
MSDEHQDTEQRLAAYFAAERAVLRAPASLAPRVASRLAAPPSRPRRARRLAALTTLAAAVTVAVALLFFVGPFGGGNGGLRTAEAVLAAALEAQDHPESVGLKSLSGTIEITGSSEEGDGRQTAGARAQFWFEAPDRLRAEIELRGRSLLFVRDGADAWVYDPGNNAYARMDADTFSSSLPFQDFFEIQTLQSQAVMLVGEGDFEELLRQTNAEDGTDFHLVGEDEIAGRPAYLLESTHEWSEAISALDVLATAVPMITPAPTVSQGDVPRLEFSMQSRFRLSLDRKYFFPLALSVDSTIEFSVAGKTESGRARTDARFTDIPLNPALSADLFAFTPPPGARQVESIELDAFLNLGLFEEDDEEEEAEPTPQPGTLR